MKANPERRVAQDNVPPAMADAEFDSFVQMLMHEVSAPLRAIDAFADLLGREYGQRWDRGGKTYLRHITRASDRLRKLTEDVHRLSRANSHFLARTTFDLSSMAHCIFDELRSLDPQRRVDTRVAEGMSCTADERLLRMAMQNLMSNAWKYTGMTENAVIEVGMVKRPGEPTTYYIRDNGVGFDAKHAADIFVPFRRLHAEAQFQGTGMGLAIVEKVISRHSGTIKALGIVGAGATFNFTVDS